MRGVVLLVSVDWRSEMRTASKQRIRSGVSKESCVGENQRRGELRCEVYLSTTMSQWREGNLKCRSK